MVEKKGVKNPTKDCEEQAEVAEGAQQGEPVCEEQAETAQAEGSEGSEAVAAEPAEEGNTQYLRLMADFQNYRKRVEKEKGDIYAFANEKLVSELLDVIDNFERALGQDSEGKDGFMEGMAMIFKQFKGVLEKAGLQEIESVGTDFDPNFHHAVMTEPGGEYESGKVTAVLQKGYTLNSKVIRPSMVKVAE